jgi:hypothetical protein
MLVRYSDWAPTTFDASGLALEDRQDWFVVWVKTRDSSPLGRSNFRVILKDLGGESEEVEVHRFGHWGCGWLEVILAHPNLRSKAEDWQRALENYPVACDSDFSEEEHEESMQVWQSFSVSERVSHIRDNREEFSFESFGELRRCVSGDVFLGSASTLLA